MKKNHPEVCARSIAKRSELIPEYFASLYLNSDQSDITFCIENERIPAHKLILASKEYFRERLYGKYANSKQIEIRISNIGSKSFKAIMKYIYCGYLELSNLTMEEMLDILTLADTYGFSELVTVIVSHLELELSLSNVCAILEASRILHFEELTEKCLDFLDLHASEILLHRDFLGLSQESLCCIIKRNTFYALEVQIFVAVHNWIKKNHLVADFEPVLSWVRLSLMTYDQLIDIVRTSALVNPDTLLQVIKAQKTEKTSPSVNVASTKLGGVVIEGRKRGNLLIDNFDERYGYTCHKITEVNNESITVQLSTAMTLNHIQLLLWNRTNKLSYKYFIEVSADHLNWDRVIDHTRYLCHSWQYLYFSTRFVRYIRLVGVHATVGTVFAVVSLKAFHMDHHIPDIFNGFVTPVENVATKDRGAIVLKDERNIHDENIQILADKEIIIQLSQPYYIGSIRFLLCEVGSRTSRFYVQTSLDMNTWYMAVDQRHEDMVSEPVLNFTPRLIVYVKIVGTQSSIDKLLPQTFRCNCIELPAQQDSPLNSSAEDTSPRIAYKRVVMSE